MIDATFFKVHQHGANPRGGAANQGIGRSKGGPTTKLHALVDEFGTLVGLELSAGNRNDCVVAPVLLAAVSSKTVLADRAYDTDAIRHLLRQNRSKACIPSAPRRRVVIPHDEELYRRRHIVENVFQRLKVFRTVDTRYQKLLRNVEGAVLCASVLLTLGYQAPSR